MSGSNPALRSGRDFDRKVAVITGGSQGLGNAVARQMAERGATGLVLVGRDQAKGEAAAAAIGDHALFVSADLADRDAPDEIIAAADERFGRIDCLVNGAALTVRASVWDCDADMWDKMLAINTRAPAMLITGAAKVMKREGIEGTVVNVGSVAATTGADFLYPYSASKIALQAITRNAAYSLMRHRIRVNLIQPGWMATPGEDVIQKRFHGADDNWLEAAGASRPFGRLIDPEEAARSICFLASEESGMMTGAVINYDQSILGAEGEGGVPPLTPVWGEPD